MGNENLQSAKGLLDWSISISKTAESKAHAVCDVVQRLVGPTGGVSLILSDPEGGGFAWSASTIPGQVDGFGSRLARPERGVTAAILRDRCVVACPRVSAAESTENPMLLEWGIESYVGVPVISRGRAIGAAYILSRHPQECTGGEIHLLTGLADHAGDSLATTFRDLGSEPSGEGRVAAAPAKASVWDAILHDPVRGSALVDEDGVIRMWSTSMARCWGTSPTLPAPLTEALPADVAEEILVAFERCRMGEVVCGITGMHDGTRHVTTCQLVRERPDGRDRFWVSTSHSEDVIDPPEAFCAVSSNGSSLGALGTLSRRELEVFALFGEGLGLTEIARRLSRSRKTIDNHRRSIGTKLGARSLPHLVEMSAKSGIRLRDVLHGPQSERSLPTPIPA